MSDFLGRGWHFPLRFDPRSKGVQMVSEVEDIEESLRILLSTHPGERIMLPAYGCAIRRMQFESLNEPTLTELKDLVRKAILFFEPRVTLLGVQATVRDPLNGLVELLLSYSVRTTNTRHNLVYPLYLHQATSQVAR